MPIKFKKIGEGVGQSGQENVLICHADSKNKEKELGGQFACQPHNQINTENREKGAFGGFLRGFQGGYLFPPHPGVKKDRIGEKGKSQALDYSGNNQQKQIADNNKHGFYGGNDQRDNGFRQKVIETFHTVPFFVLKEFISEIGNKKNSETLFKKGNAELD